jgi:hypothetical protein
MRPAMYHLSISAARADAVFASALQRSAEPTAGQVRQAMAEAVRAFGSRGCAARVAQEFGDHPETAAARMRWARTVADQAFATRRAPVRGEAPGTTGAARIRGPEPGRTRLVARHVVAAVGRAA